MSHPPSALIQNIRGIHSNKQARIIYNSFFLEPKKNGKVKTDSKGWIVLLEADIEGLMVSLVMVAVGLQILVFFPLTGW